jgi:hypothetical protein
MSKTKNDARADEATTTIETADEKALLLRVQRFVLNVVERGIAGKAARIGYDAAEHALGCGLLRDASGLDRPFPHYLSSAEIALSSSDERTRAAVRELDVFENTWFPRVRNAIRRFVPEGRAALVEQAFFDGLEQQPEGVTVIVSVEKLVERLKGLRASKEPGAQDAYAALEKKGLHDDALARVGAIVTEIRTLAV